MPPPPGTGACDRPGVIVVSLADVARLALGLLRLGGRGVAPR